MKHSYVKLAVLVVAVLALMACGSGQEDALKKLGQMNIPYNEDSFIDRAKNADTVAVKLFLAAGMDPNTTGKAGKTALMVAARGGYMEIVQLLLDKGADVNARDKRFEATPLIWAALGGHNDIELLRVHHQFHTSRIDDHLFALYIRVGFSHTPCHIE